MFRSFVSLLIPLTLWLGSAVAPHAADYVKTELPASIDSCFKKSIAGVFDINRDNERRLFDFFLTNIDVEQFGIYNYKRAWRDWASDPAIKRLALYEYFSLMTSRRSDIAANTTTVEARLADRPVVRGDNVYHIIARVNFDDGSSQTIVVFTVGCKAFGFMYGGTDLRSLMDANVIERLYRKGARAP